MGQEIIGRRTIRRWLDNWEHIQRREPMEDQVRSSSAVIIPGVDFPYDRQDWWFDHVLI